MAHGDVTKITKVVNGYNKDICLGYFTSKDLAKECTRNDDAASLKDQYVVELNGKFYALETNIQLCIDTNANMSNAKLRLEALALLSPAQRKALGV